MPDTVLDRPVQVVILPELLDAFAKSPSIIQRDLYAFFTRFRQNPLDAGLGGRRLEGAPESFRLYDVNSAWSAVAAFPQEGLAILMTASWRKSAEQWAAGHRL